MPDEPNFTAAQLTTAQRRTAKKAHARLQDIIDIINRLGGIEKFPPQSARINLGGQAGASNDKKADNTNHQNGPGPDKRAGNSHQQSSPGVNAGNSGMSTSNTQLTGEAELHNVTDSLRNYELNKTEDLLEEEHSKSCGYDVKRSSPGTNRIPLIAFAAARTGRMLYDPCVAFKTITYLLSKGHDFTLVHRVGFEGAAKGAEIRDPLRPWKMGAHAGRSFVALDATDIQNARYGRP
ncbi:hypothetical protein M0657_000330 [Pyricularia oryzae]|nr:hypothetical protein M9X92_003995 [Pyricularia oryzae]KAI7932581.1 hypothetical protein M0657_000330 [Pyricularia oryzae]